MTPAAWWKRVRDARPTRGDAIAAFALGLAARAIAVLWAAPRFPPVADAHFYDVIARRIAGGHGYTWLWPDGAVTYAAHYPVGYPAFVGALYAIAGAHPAIAMGANAVIGALAVPAVHRVAATVAARPGALLAALLVALHPGLVMYTPALMTEGIVAALIAIAAWLAVRAAESAGRSRIAWLAGLGLLLGVATLVRPQTLLLAPLFGAYAARRRLLGAIAVGALATAVCLPWTVRNCERMGRCVLVSANGGWNLFIGAAPGATGSWVALDRLGVPERCRDVFGEADKDLCFGRAALSAIAREPGRFLALVPAKLGATFDYSGAPGWYLHASNAAAFDDRDKLILGVVETLWERLSALLALVAAATAAGPRRRLRAGVAAATGLFLLLRPAWVGYLGVVLVAALLGRRLVRHPPALLAGGALALTALTHAVFFGAGRYSLVCFALLPALAGAAVRGFDTA